MAENSYWKPYADESTNFIYNLLFCDDLSLFTPRRKGETPASWVRVLLAANPDAKAVRSLAEDESAESRVRVLAYNWLRQHRQNVPRRKLFGVIVEVPVQGGLDVLAAYQDGRVRYINHTEKTAVFEDVPAAIAAKSKELIGIAQVVVNRIGPREGTRLPPPKEPNVRLTFLVSDGLYIGEGKFEAIYRDNQGGPVLQCASQLLQLVVKAVR